MDDGRLGAVNRGIRKTRRVIYVTNEIIKNKQKQYESSLHRDHDNMVYKMAASEFKARKAALMSRVLLQCLEMRKQLSSSSDVSDLGAYGGRSLDSFSKEIDQLIAWQHPRLRRLRLVDRIKRNCMDQGEILKDDVAKSRMERFFQQMREDEERRAKAKLRQQAKPQRKLRWRGGLPVYDDEEAREGDFPDPYGTVKLSLDVNPFEKLAGLIPNHYKADLLKPLWIDTPRGHASEDTRRGSATEGTPTVYEDEVVEKPRKGRGHDVMDLDDKYDHLPAIHPHNKMRQGSKHFNGGNSSDNSRSGQTPNGLDQKLSLADVAEAGGGADTVVVDDVGARGGASQTTGVMGLVLPPINVTKETIG